MPNHPAQLEPYVLDDVASLRPHVIELIESDAALAALVHPITQKSIAALVQGMNCYYSNLIEGHRTLPIDIEKAMRHDFSTDKSNRDRQLLAAAHMETEQQVLSWLAAGVDPWSAQFVLQVHERFCAALPPEMLELEDGSQMIPGQWRTQQVSVGNHLPPSPQSLPRFIERYSETQHALRERDVRIANAIAGHHRLAWIHPFADGNGRVGRIVTDAQLKRLDINIGSLWSWSRGLAKSEQRYKGALADADQPRQGDLDGRGNLSTKALVEFTRFGLEVAVDQAKFMASMLRFDELKRRVETHFLRERADLKLESSHIVIAAIAHGEISRGDAQRVSGLKERSARDALGKLLKHGYLRTESPKGALRAAFPTHALGSFFPNLYPAGSLDLER